MSINNVRWLWGVHKALFFRVTPTCFWIGPSLFWLRPSMFRVRPSHFSSHSFPLFEVSLSHFLTQTFSFFRSLPFSFLELDLPIFWVSLSHFLKSVLLSFQLRPSHFFGSVPPILFSKLLFDYIESILQFMGLIRCLNLRCQQKVYFPVKKLVLRRY